MIKYKWKDKENNGNKLTYGLSAQDLEQVYPEMVHTDEDGIKSIFYTELIPVLIQVTQEQQALIEAQGRELEAISKRLTLLEKKEIKK